MKENRWTALEFFVKTIMIVNVYVGGGFDPAFQRTVGSTG